MKPLILHQFIEQGRIQDLIGGAPDHDRPKTAIRGPQFCRILMLGPHFWWSGGPRVPPGSAPALSRKQVVDILVQQISETVTT